ncbi:MAG: hypothetical protein WBB28_15785 [Crinalium sp.]
MKDKQVSTVPPREPSDKSWMETVDDEITAGSKQCMSHKERYEFVKNRTYSKNQPGQPLVNQTSTNG